MSNLTVETINSRTVGDTTLLEWDGVAVDLRTPYDRSKYDTVRLYGWFDTPQASSINGLFFQPTTGASLDGRLLSFMNGGGSNETWIDPDDAVPRADQMYWNSVATGTVRWQIDLTLLNTGTNVWSSTGSLQVYTVNGAIPSQGKGFRFLLAQTWDNASGNSLNGWRINSTAPATNNKGELRLEYSKTNTI